MAMGRRLTPLKTGAEHDALTRWRRSYAYLKRAGATASIKRQFRRRERHQVTPEAIREQV